MKPSLEHTRVWDCDECGAQLHTASKSGQQCPWCLLPMTYQYSYVGSADTTLSCDLTDLGFDGKMVLQT